MEQEPTTESNDQSAAEPNQCRQPEQRNTNVGQSAEQQADT